MNVLGSRWLASWVAVAGMLLGGCGGGGTSGAGGGGGATSSTGTGSGPETVTVVMKEFSLAPDKAKLPAGSIKFVADNQGMDVHELVLLKTDLAEDMLPLDMAGDVDEAGAGVTAVGEVEDVPPGKTGEFTVDVKPGKHVLICNISMVENGVTEHHYALGMHVAFTAE